MIGVSLMVPALFGCSMGGPPPPMEKQVHEADQIVLARAVRATPPAKRATTREERRDPARLFGTVTFEVVELLAGKPIGKELVFAGQVDRYDGPYKRSPLEEGIRRGGRHGSCYAYDYRLDGLFLFILKGGTPYWAPLQPMNEEVTSRDDPWVSWVRSQLGSPP